MNKSSDAQRKRRLLAPASKRIAYAVPEAGALIGLGRNSSYAAAKAGEIPTIEINGRLLVPKAPFHRLFGIETAAVVEE